MKRLLDHLEGNYEAYILGGAIVAVVVVWLWIVL